MSPMTADTDYIAATIRHTLGTDHHKEYHTSPCWPMLLVPHGRVSGDLLTCSRQARL